MIKIKRIDVCARARAPKMFYTNEQKKNFKSNKYKTISMRINHTKSRELTHIAQHRVITFNPIKREKIY